MPLPRPTLVDDLIALSDSGTRYRVYIWQLWIDEKQPGLKEARLSTGDLVHRIDDDTFEIARTLVRLKRDRSVPGA